MTARTLDKFATDRWIDALDVTRVCKVVMRSIVSKIDTRTGQSHPRFPILQAAIARAVSYSIASVCRALDALESMGLVIRRRMRPRRRADGTVRQDPTDYELVLPAECWRVLQPVESSHAARVTTPVSIGHDEPWSIKVCGKLSTSDASTKRRTTGWQLQASPNTTFLDDMPVDELAPRLLDAAMVASERVDDSLRHRTIVCLDELRKRASDVALLACNLNLDSWGTLNTIRHWIAKCVTNPAQRVDSGEHSMNILRKFLHEQREWAFVKGPARIDELIRAKRERVDVDTHDAAPVKTHSSGIIVNRGDMGPSRDAEPAPEIDVTWEPLELTDYDPLPYELDEMAIDDDWMVV